jgi:hypothetical protein
MLLFESDSQTVFNDHLDASVRYTLPATAVVSETRSGTPDFLLLRYAGDFATERGGILRGVLSLQYLQPDTNDTTANDTRPVSFMAGYSRLRLRPFGDNDIQTGQWHKIDTLEQNRLSMLAYLHANDTQILRSLLSDGGDVVSMEIHLVYRGLVAGIPWLIRASTERLNAHMQAQLGEDPASVDHIVAAFLSLPEGVLTWHFIGNADDTPDEPTRATMHTEAALHALTHLFEPVASSDFMAPRHYRYVPRNSSLSPHFSYALFNYRHAQRAHTLHWSISDLFERHTEQERDALFPTVTQISPFARVKIHVINSLPFDPAFLTGLTIDVKNIGAQGIFENRSVQFTAGSEQVAQFSTFQPLLSSSLTLQYRITAMLASSSPDAWPMVIQRDFVPSKGTVIDINRQTAGIEFVHLSADTAVFANSSAIDITLTLPDADRPLAAVQLTGETPVIWVALPDITAETGLHITCRAQPLPGLDGEPFTLCDGPLTGREVAIHAGQLEVLEADDITVTLDAPAGEPYPLVAFEITSDMGANEGILRTLEPDRVHVWRVLRRNVFTPLAYRYRLHVVARHEDGHTLPMVVTDWREASTHHHHLDTAFIAEHLPP